MRIFWSFIALILLGTALLFIVPSLAAERERTAASEAINDTPDEMKTPTLFVKHDESSVLTSKSEDDPAVEKTPLSISDPKETLDRNREPSDDAARQVIEDIQEIFADSVVEDSTPTAPDAIPASSEMTPEVETTGETTMLNAATVNTPEETAPADPKKRFKVLGSGTKDAPYRVTWELLTSAYESYRPREGKNEIPEWVQMLHDKYVKISGYLAFPMLTGEVDEALVMLNQWDGCCLGVPPSPYDSIEVRLAYTMTAERGAFTPFGAVEGKLLVDPYLVNGWLVGLYLMEEALVEMVE